MDEPQADGAVVAEVASSEQPTRPAGFWNRVMSEGDPADGGPVQFGVGAVLLLQALAAGALSLLMALDVFGVFILFVGTVAVMFWRVSPQNVRRRRLFADLLAGVVMPIICVVFDPGILRHSTPGEVAVSGILFQVVMLVVWQLMPRGRPAICAFFAGYLCVGLLLATVIGIVMLPLTLLGLLVLIGLLCTMPFLTAIVYLRNSRSAARSARVPGANRMVGAMFVLGVAVATGFPILAHKLLGRQIAGYLNLMNGQLSDW